MKKSKPESILGKQGPQIRTRSFVLFSIVSLIAVMLIGRLFYLQIINYKKYRAAVIEQMIYETPISASRGLITDRNGVVLATNYTTERIFISPYDIETEEERTLICKGLSEILDVDYDYIYEQSTKTKYKDRTIKKNVDEATADIVRPAWSRLQRLWPVAWARSPGCRWASCRHAHYASVSMAPSWLRGCR